LLIKLKDEHLLFVKLLKNVRNFINQFDKKSNDLINDNENVAESDNEKSVTVKF
jgi:hypothetical protein